MRGKDASLVGTGWRDEEVERLVLTVWVATDLNETAVDDAATRWVVQTTIAVLHEEALVDALVDND